MINWLQALGMNKATHRLNCNYEQLSGKTCSRQLSTCISVWEINCISQTYQQTVVCTTAGSCIKMKSIIDTKTMDSAHFRGAIHCFYM